MQFISRKSNFIIITILLYLTTSFVHASNKRESVTLQLQWKDQFEFAGFYAAKEKGFYKEVGLDVTFKSFDPTQNIVDEVLEGKAEYGLVYSSLISRYFQGDPLVFVANFFKYSPLILVTQKEYTLPSDLKGKKIMGVSHELNSETIMMMFKKFHMSSNDLNIITPSFKIQDFIDKNIDAMSVYATNEIFELVKSKVKFNVLNPSAYGIPSYDLNLFTTKEELIHHPKRVANFRAASIKGWEYALKHQEEIIQLIMQKYNSQKKSYEALKYEASQIQDIMLPSILPIGSIDPQKVALIAENFMELKLVPKIKTLDLDAFIYQVPPQDLKLTIEEKNYLQSKHEITYCVDPSWMPLSKIQDGKHIGIDSDIIQTITQKLKRHFKLIPTKDWEQTLASTKAGQCDILTFVTQTPGREEYLSFTPNIMYTPLVLVTTIDKRFVDDIRELSKEKIGIVKGYAYKKLLSDKYPFLQITEVDNVEEGLKKVAKKELYGFIDNLSVLSYAIEQNHFGAMKVSAKTDIDVGYGYAVQKNDTILLSILNKAISTIDEGEKHKIFNKWSRSHQDDDKHYFETIIKILGFLFLIFIPLIYHYRKIQKDNIKLEDISSKDVLSGLYNRRYMDQYIQQVYKKQSYEQFSLILVDIDNFKSINDTYGHPYGDKVITQMSDILRNHVRSEDTVSRWGGEEFLIFCPNATQDDGYQLSERLRVHIQNNLTKENGEPVTCSFGVAEYRSSHTEQDTYLQKVDQALYSAKRAGKNRVEIY